MAPRNVENAGAAVAALEGQRGNFVEDLPPVEVLEKQTAGARGNPLGDALAIMPALEVKREAALEELEGSRANAVEVSKLLKEGVLTEIPPAFIFPKHMQPLIPHDDFCDDQDIPIIDMSPYFTKDAAGLKKLIRDIAIACESKGFFHLVGHGVPEQLMKQAQAHARTLFNLPLDEKLKGCFSATSTRQRRGYSSTPKTVTPAPALIWQEGFTLIGGKSGEVDVDSYAEKLWSHDELQRRSFSEVYQEYAGHSMRLALTLKDLIIKALKVDPNHFKPYFEQPAQVLHLTWYPPAPSPQEVLGLNPHYDIGFFTLISQDEVPGLQIRGKDGNWFSVRPVPGAFCFNVADTLEALSNGRFKSNLHRVVVNREKPRLSVSTFLSAAMDNVIEPAPELVDDDHPRLYRSFTFGEYMTTVRAKGMDSISNCGQLLEFVKIKSSS